MDTPTVRGTAADGLRLLEAAQWDAARQVFEDSLATADTPDARDGLGLALWFLGHIEDGIGMREQAFEAYARAGRCDIAARVGVWVSHQHLLAGRSSAARGWLARADRAATGTDCDGRGWIAVERARHCVDVVERTALTQRAMTIARRSGDSDLEVFALSLLGLTRGARGPARGRDGAAGGGDGGGHRRPRAQRPHPRRGVLQPHPGRAPTPATGTAPPSGAISWTASRATTGRSRCSAPAAPSTPTCWWRAGRWTEAEQALASALHDARPLRAGDGRLRAWPAWPSCGCARAASREAEQLLAGREEHPASLCALARLRIADGRPGVAVALLERALRGRRGRRRAQHPRPRAAGRGPAGHRRRRRRRRGRSAARARSRRTSAHPPRRGPGPPGAALVALARGRLDDVVGPGPPGARRVRPAGHAARHRRVAVAAGPRVAGDSAGRRARRGPGRARRVPGAGCRAGRRRRGGRAARAGGGDRSGPARARRPDRPRGGGAGPAAARHDQRRDRRRARDHARRPPGTT